MAVTLEQTPAPADSGSKQEEERGLHWRTEQIGRKLAALSGKGGAGKSTVTANLGAECQAGRCNGSAEGCVDDYGPAYHCSCR
jgi:Mrp family chromosome partitioning ATPase